MRVPALLAGCALLLAAPAAADGAVKGADFRFIRYSLEEGLSQGLVYCIEQDRRGLLWIGTKDGLDLFDGYRFTVFNHDPFDSTSLSHNRVESLHADREGNLWVGTAQGLNLLSPGLAGFRRILGNPSDPNCLGRKAILCLHRDHEGCLWIGTDAGLDRFDPATEELAHYLHAPSDPHSLSGDRVLELYEDSCGHLWLGTDGGLDRFDPVTGKFTHFCGDSSSAPGPNAAIRSIVETESGSLLLGTESGLWRLDLRRGDCERVPLPGEAEGRDVEAGSGPLVTGLAVDALGRVWVATFDGVFVLSSDLECIVRLCHDPGDRWSLGHTGVNCVFQDSCEVVWIGTNGYGLNSWSPYQSKFERYSQARYSRAGVDSGGMRVKSVRAIYEDPTGAVWVGGYESGLDRLDPVSGGFTSFDNPYGSVIRTVIGDPDAPGEVLWVGTEGSGLLRFDVPARTFHRYPIGSAEGVGLVGRFVYSMRADPGGKLWIGTERGINVFDRSDGTFSLLHCCPGGRTIYAIAVDQAGSMWVGASGGLARLDPGASDFVHYVHDPDDCTSLSNDNVLCVREDTRGTIWVGTDGGGLNRLNRSEDTFSHYMIKDGLPNNVVYGILEDGEGMLWISTNAGLARFDPATETFHNYDVDDGLQSAEFNASAYHKGLSGCLYFGGISGFNVIRPYLLRDDPHPPRVVIRDFMFNNKSVPVGPMDDGRRLLTRTISETSRLDLSYQHGVLSFELAAMNFAVPSRNTYAYKLEGLDEDWNYIGSRRYVTFTDLEPGQYTLRVKAANSDGVWSEPAAPLELIVRPPFWATWWFKGSAVLALGLIAIGLHRARTGIIRRRSAELRASKEFLDSIINALDDPVFVKDEKHRLVVLNDSACEMMGLPREELIGKTEYEVFPKDRADLLRKADDEVFGQDGTVVADDVVDLRGERRTISTKRSVFADQATGKRFIAGAIRDITEIKRYESALEDRLRFESLVSRISADLMNPPVSGIDAVIDDGLKEIGEFLGADRVVIRLLRGQEDTPAKVYAWRADGSSQPQVREDFEAAFPNLAKELQGGCGLVFEEIEDIPASWRPEHDHMAEIGIKSGVVVPLSVGGSLLGSISVLMIGSERVWEDDVLPRVRVLGGTLANALNRKRAEENLRQSQQKYWSILENIGIGIALVSREMRVLEINKKMREWFPECKSGEGAHGHLACEHSSKDHHSPDCPTALALSDGLVHEATTTTPVDGGIVSFRIVSSPIRNSDGEIVAAIELVEDVTEKQRLEEQLRHSQKMEAIGTLAGGIAHDFNNILYAILGYANLAKADTPAGLPVHDCLEQIETAGHRAAELVEHILAFGRHSEGSFKPIRLQTLIDEALMLLHGSFPSTVEIRLSISGDCGMIDGDPTQIHQLLINLCTNAFQAMLNHRGVLEVRLDEVEADNGLVGQLQGLALGRCARLVIRDDGIGMDDETIKRIFEPYFTTKDQGEGSGLGLAMVHGIVKNHRGAIRVESKPGWGATFEVYIPICGKAAESAEAQPADNSESSVLANVLFVDDEPMIAEMCEKILSKIGHRVSKFTDSVKALEAFRLNPFAFDVIISDVTMPRLTGFELADEVRALRADIPIILCTGYCESVDSKALEELCIQKCVWKPLDFQDLAEMIQEVLGAPSSTEV